VASRRRISPGIDDLEKLLDDSLSQPQPASPKRDLSQDPRDRKLVHLVESDPLLQSIVGRLLKRGFLLPGVSHPLAYGRNKELIESEWKVSKSEESALAMGVSVTNDYFFEGIHEVLNGSDFLVSSVSTMRLESWQKEVRALFGHQSKMIIDSATTIGQYLEFMNRKSQGF
jgi:hypothetical protein